MTKKVIIDKEEKKGVAEKGLMEYSQPVQLGRSVRVRNRANKVLEDSLAEVNQITKPVGNGSVKGVDGRAVMSLKVVREEASVSEQELVNAGEAIKGAKASIESSLSVLPTLELKMIYDSHTNSNQIKLLSKEQELVQSNREGEGRDKAFSNNGREVKSRVELSKDENKSGDVAISNKQLHNKIYDATVGKAASGVKADEAASKPGGISVL